MLKRKKINLLGNFEQKKASVKEAVNAFLNQLKNSIETQSEPSPETELLILVVQKMSSENWGEFKSSFNLDIALLKEWFDFSDTLEQQLNPKNPFDEKFEALKNQIDDTASYLIGSFKELDPDSFEKIHHWLAPDSKTHKTNGQSANSELQESVDLINMPDGFLETLFEPGSQGGRTLTDSPEIQIIDDSENIEIDQAPGEVVVDEVETEPLVEESLNEIENISDQNEVNPFKLGFNLADLFEKGLSVQPSGLVEADKVFPPEFTDNNEKSFEETLQEKVDIEELVEETLDEIEHETAVSETEYEDQDIPDIIDEDSLEDQTLTEIDEVGSDLSVPEVIELEKVIESQKPELLESIPDTKIHRFVQDISRLWIEKYKNDQYFDYIKQGIDQLLHNQDLLAAFKEVSDDVEFTDFTRLLETVDSNPYFSVEMIQSQLTLIADRGYKVFVKIFEQQTTSTENELDTLVETEESASLIEPDSEMDAVEDIDFGEELVDDDFEISDNETSEVLDESEESIISSMDTEDFEESESGSIIEEPNLESELLEAGLTELVNEDIADEEVPEGMTTEDSLEFSEAFSPDLSDESNSYDDLDQVNIELEEVSEEDFDKQGSDAKPVDKSSVYYETIRTIFNDVKQLNSVDENSSAINQFINFSLSLKDPVELLRDHLNILDVKDFIVFIDELHSRWDNEELDAYQPMIEHTRSIADQIYTILLKNKEITGDLEDPEASALREVDDQPIDGDAIDEAFEESISDQSQTIEDISEETTSEEATLSVPEISDDLTDDQETTLSEDEVMEEETVDFAEDEAMNSLELPDDLAEVTDLPDEDLNADTALMEIDDTTSIEDLAAQDTDLTELPDDLDELSELETIGDTSDEQDLESIEDGFSEDEKDERVEIEESPIASTIPQKQELNEIQKIFLLEAEENIQKISTDLLELEKDLGDFDLIDSIMRSAHTLKGSAAMMKFNNMSKLGHKMEDVFQFLRDNKIHAERELIDIMLKGTDIQTTMLESLRSDGHDQVSGLNESIHNLQEYLKQLSAKREGADYKPEKFVSSEPDDRETAAIEKSGDYQTRPDTPRSKKPAMAEQTLRIDITTLNSLINLAAELLISRNRMNNQLGTMESVLLKLQKEKAMLTTVLKKVQQLAGKSELEGGAGGFLSEEEQGILKDFADTEFDRFSEYDVILRDMRGNLSNFEDLSQEIRELSDAFRQSILGVSTIANELNREIMSMRMVPVKHMFIRFQRSIRDIGREEGKEVDLKIEGEETRLDKTVMEEVIEPIMHLVRNSVSHGIEPPEKRKQTSKDPVGLIILRAFQDGNQVAIEVEDDGGGINVPKIKSVALAKRLVSPERAEQMTDSEAMELMFIPGFSTADKVTSLSGRGVGMDVVKSVVTKYKGTVSVKSNIGKGSCFTVKLPLTLAINQSLLINVGGRIYAFPLNAVEETFELHMENIKRIGDQELITVRDETIPLIHLQDVLGSSDDFHEEKRSRYPVVILQEGDQKIAVRVNRLLGKEEIVVKSLGTHLKNILGVMGATVLGDGSVVLILDVVYLFQYWQGGRVPQSSQISSEIASRAGSLEPLSEEEDSDETSEPVMHEPVRSRRKGKIRILCADDSVSIRKYVESLLSRENFEVTTAPDGAEAFDLAEKNRYDVIMTDLEMPKMHGYELVSALRSRPQFNNIPIVILTARSGEKHKRRGLELGANAFLNKPFDIDELLNTITGLVG